MKTKERILVEALRLFEKRGFEAVSVSDIAGCMGMTKGALYRHYRDKQDILESIIEQMRENDRIRAQEYEVPEDTFRETPEDYRESELISMIRFLEAQFDYWTEDSFAAPFRRMLTIEQYRSEEMAALHYDYVGGGVIDYITDFFREQMSAGKMRVGEPAAVACEFYGPAYLMMGLYDGAKNKEQIKQMLQTHLKVFEERYVIR